MSSFQCIVALRREKDALGWSRVTYVSASEQDVPEIRGWRRLLYHDAWRTCLAIPLAVTLNPITTIPLPKTSFDSLLLSAPLVGWATTCGVLSVLGLVAFCGDRPLGPRLLVSSLGQPRWKTMLGLSIREGPGVVVGISLAAVMFSFLLVAVGTDATWSTIGAVAAAIGGSWLYTWTSFAIHHARIDHTYPGALEFPGRDERRFVDYLYFSLMIQCTFGTTDVAVTHRTSRSAVMSQTICAFAYNTIALAVLLSVLVGR